MSLSCIGINHRTASVARREQVALGVDAQRRWLSAPGLRERRDQAGVTEVAVLSTCNRTELYAVHAERLPATALVELFASLARLSANELTPHLYELKDQDALRHLFAVAAGLDSMVLGEAEILGQVRTARETACGEGAAGPILDAAFRAAAQTGRRARHETGICRLPASVATEAVRLLGAVAGPLEHLALLIVGTGKMGRVVGETFRRQGGQRIAVISRTRGHAEALAAQWNAVALPWHDLSAAVRAADVILSSTGAPHVVLTRELVEQALGPRGDGRRRVIVDIAVPRDVEPSVGSVPGVALYDIDDLQARVGENLEIRSREVPAVERIVAEELARFDAWLRSWTLRPVLTRMHARGETIRQRELARVLRRLGPVSPETREQFESFSRALVNQLLDAPSRRLREPGDPANAETFGAITRELFGLDGQDGQDGSNAQDGPDEAGAEVA
ncbi:MAG TPA: glutamyl-tRNA reductase [Gemmatimonadales bacterium]|nr:glutamyl-tRNA reductase [Gemmatimonadales bacterium]